MTAPVNLVTLNQIMTSSTITGTVDSTPAVHKTEDGLLHKYFTGGGNDSVGDSCQIIVPDYRQPTDPRRPRKRLFYVSTGGWQLMRTSGTSYILSLDIPLSGAGAAGMWRTRAVRVARECGVTILPVTRAAFPQANYTGRYKSLKVVELADDMESVFVLDGDRYYLSGYDRQETPALYFLCRLPGPVGSVAEARESLKPASVKAAEAQEIMVERQGDIFAIRSELTTDKLSEMGAVWHRGKHAASIYGTAHTATDLATLPNHLMLAHGSLIHSPQRVLREPRAGDHTPRPLGDGTHWWWLTRNTVPIAGRRDKW